jgi:hypothetical protein
MATSNENSLCEEFKKLTSQDEIEDHRSALLRAEFGTLKLKMNEIGNNPDLKPSERRASLGELYTQIMDCKAKLDAIDEEIKFEKILEKHTELASVAYNPPKYETPQDVHIRAKQRAYPIATIKMNRLKLRTDLTKEEFQELNQGPNWHKRAHIPKEFRPPKWKPDPTADPASQIDQTPFKMVTEKVYSKLQIAEDIPRSIDYDDRSMATSCQVNADDRAVLSKKLFEVKFLNTSEGNILNTICLQMGQFLRKHNFCDIDRVNSVKAKFINIFRIATEYYFRMHEKQDIRSHAYPMSSYEAFNIIQMYIAKALTVEGFMDQAAAIWCANNVCQGDDPAMDVLTEEMDVTANVTMADQRPEQGESVSMTQNVTTPMNHMSMSEDLWQIRKILARPMRVYGGKWAETDEMGKSLFAISLPEILNNNPNNLTVTQLKVFSFLHSDMEILFQLNGTKFHIGRIIAWLEPVRGEQDEYIIPVNNIFAFPHVILDASVSNSGVLKVPWNSVLSYFAQVPGSSEPSLNTLGILRLSVINPLMIAECASNHLTYSVYVSFPNANVTQPTNQFDHLEYGKGYVQGLFQSGVNAAYEGANKLTGGVLNRVSDTLETLLGNPFNCDRPLVTTEAAHVVNKGVSPINYGAGPDQSVRLALSPVSKTLTSSEEIGMVTSDMDLKRMCQVFGRVQTIDIKVDDPVGKVLFKTPVSPTICHRNIMAGGRVEFVPTPVAYCSRAFQKWRGSMNFKAQAVASLQHSFRVAFCFVPRAAEGETELTLDELMSFNVCVMDAQEKHEITVSCPYNTITPWLIANYFRSPDNISQDYDGLGSWYSGYLYIVLLNSLVAPCNVSSTIQMNVLMAAGDDFELAIPSPIRDIALWGTDPGWLDPKYDYTCTTSTADFTTTTPMTEVFIGATYGERDNIYGARFIIHDGQLSTDEFLSLSTAIRSAGFTCVKIAQSTESTTWFSSKSVTDLCDHSINVSGLDVGTPGYGIYVKTPGYEFMDQSSNPYSYYDWIAISTTDSPNMSLDFMRSIVRSMENWFPKYHPVSFISGTPGVFHTSTRCNYPWKEVDQSATVQGSQDFITTREEGAPVVLTSGNQQLKSVEYSLGENAMNLATVLRRYYFADFLDAPASNSSQIFAIPVTPMYNNNFNVNADGHATAVNQLAWFSRLFAFNRGSIRFKILLPNIENMDQVFCWHNPNVAQMSKVVPAFAGVDGMRELAFGSNITVTRLQGALEVEIPYASRYVQLMNSAKVQAVCDNALNPLAFINGTLFVVLPPNTKDTTINIFIAAGDDFVLNVFRGPPRVIGVSRKPYTGAIVPPTFVSENMRSVNRDHYQIPGTYVYYNYQGSDGPPEAASVQGMDGEKDIPKVWSRSYPMPIHETDTDSDSDPEDDIVEIIDSSETEMDYQEEVVGAIGQMIVNGDNSMFDSDVGPIITNGTFMPDGEVQGVPSICRPFPPKEPPSKIYGTEPWYGPGQYPWELWPEDFDQPHDFVDPRDQFDINDITWPVFDNSVPPKKVEPEVQGLVPDFMKETCTNMSATCDHLNTIVGPQLSGAASSVDRTMRQIQVETLPHITSMCEGVRNSVNQACTKLTDSVFPKTISAATNVADISKEVKNVVGYAGDAVMVCMISKNIKNMIDNGFSLWQCLQLFFETCALFRVSVSDVLASLMESFGSLPKLDQGISVQGFFSEDRFEWLFQNEEFARMGIAGLFTMIFIATVGKIPLYKDIKKYLDTIFSSGPNSVQGLSETGRDLFFCSRGLKSVEEIYNFFFTILTKISNWIMEQMGLPSSPNVEESRMESVRQNLADYKFYTNEDNVVRTFRDVGCYRRLYAFLGRVEADYDWMISSDKCPARLRSTIKHLFQECVKLEKMLMEIECSDSFRIDPMHIQVVAKAGTGKSGVIMAIEHEVAQIRGYSRYLRRYEKAYNDEFWPNFFHHPVTFIDDLGQDKEDKMIIQFEILKSNVMVRLNMAECSEKGRFFTSDLILSTTNTAYIHSTKIRCNEAFWRRRNLLFEMHRDGPITLDNNNVWFNWLDPEKEGAPYLAAHLSMQEMLRVVREQAIKYYDNQEKFVARIKSMYGHVNIADANDELEKDLMACEQGEPMDTSIDLDPHAPMFVPQAHSKEENERQYHSWVERETAKVRAFQQQLANDSATVQGEDEEEINMLKVRSLDDNQKDRESRFNDYLVDALEVERENYLRLYRRPKPKPESIDSFHSARDDVGEIGIMYKKSLVLESSFQKCKNWVKEQWDKITKWFDEHPLVKKFASVLALIGVGYSLYKMFRFVMDEKPKEVEGHGYSAGNPGRQINVTRTEGYQAGVIRSTPRVVTTEGEECPLCKCTNEVFDKHLISDRREFKKWAINDGVVEGKLNFLTATKDDFMAFFKDWAQRGEPPFKITVEDGVTFVEGFWDMNMIAFCAYCTKLKRKKSVQGTDDPNAFSLIQNRIHGYMTIFKTTHLTVNGFYVGGRNLLIPQHCLNTILDNSVIQVLQGDTWLSFKHNPARVFRYNRQVDWCIYVLPAQFMTRKFTNKFISELELSKLSNNFPAVLCGLRFKKEPGLLLSNEFHLRARSCKSYAYNDGVIQNYVQSGFEYDAQTTRGDCGSLLVAFETQLVNKILGIHTAGHTDRGEGFSVVITKEQVEKCLAQAKEKFPEAQVQGFPIPECIKIDPDSVSKIKIFPTGHFSIFGAVPTDLAPRQREETDLRKSKIFGVFPNSKAPAALKSVDGISPLVKGINKYAEPTGYMSDDEVKVCGNQVRSWMNVMPETWIGKRVLTDEEAVFGIEHTTVKSINFQSSAGWPWMMENRSGGKRFLFDVDNKKIINKSFLEKLRYREDQAIAGNRIPSCWRDCLKDELRTIEKVKDLNTRVFTVCPVDYLVLCRKYFGAFVDSFYTNWKSSFHGVGIDILSSDWTDLYRDLTKYGKFGFAGDFKKFDSKMLPQLIAEAVAIINDWYGDEFSALRFVLMDEIIHTVQIVSNCAYATHQGNPSGNPLTTVINSIVNLLYMLYAWRTIMRVKCPKIINRFFDFVKIRVFGDDNILIVKDLVSQWFNLVTVSEALKTIGIDYIDAGKTGDLEEIKHINNLSFLKCHFKQSPFDSNILAAIDEETIYQLCNWVRDESSEQLLSNIDDALRFAFRHGEEFYTDFSVKLFKAIEKIGIRVPHTSYKDQIVAYMGGENTDNLLNFHGLSPLLLSVVG